MSAQPYRRTVPVVANISRPATPNGFQSQNRVTLRETLAGGWAVIYNLPSPRLFPDVLDCIITSEISIRVETISDFCKHVD